MAPSGAPDVVDRQVLEVLSSWYAAGVDASTLSGDLVTRLTARGYLTDSTRKEDLQAACRVCERFKRRGTYPEQQVLVSHHR